MNLKLRRYIILLVIFIGLSSWGEKAHRKINSSCVEFFPPELNHLKVWAPILGDHGSDADFRKKYDKPEFVKHFIDIDNYSDFVKSHKIVEDFKAANAKYGKAFVMKNGTLPWTTDSTYLTLVQNFKSRDWNRAALTAADLGHYVGDGFMPLHTAANYDGQLSGQTGVHRRYEEIMVDRYMNEIKFRPSAIHKVDQVQSYIFQYLYANNTKVNQLLQADKEAFKAAGDQYNDKYYQTFWEKTKAMTISQLEESSKTLASLIYTAWIEAGKPDIPKNPGLPTS
ncbi:MAG: phospholipase C/P1 nuclease family protein [Paludibacter sp.]